MNTDSRSYNSARNLTMSIVQKVVSIVLTFIGRQIFLQVLTVEYLGINGLFINIFSMLSLADLGLATAMSFSFYKPLAEKNEEKLAALIGFYRRIYNVIAAVVAVAGLALTPFLKYIINLESDIPYIEVYYLIALANTVVSYLFVYKATIITADQHGSIVTKYYVWTSIIGMLLQIAILLTTGNFMAYCLVSVLGTLGNNVLISRKSNKMYPFIKRKARLDAGDRRDIINNIKSMFIYKVSGVVFKGTDNIFISALISTAIVGKYENYLLAVTNLSMFAFMIFTSLTPSLGNMVAKERKERQTRIFKMMQAISYWLAGFFVYCLFFLLDDFVVLWLGGDFVFGFSTKIAILVNFYQTITLYPIIAFREATGIYQKTKYVMVVAAVLKIAFSTALGILYGLVGIIIATTVSRLLTYAWYEPKILFRDHLGCNTVAYLLGHAANFVMLSACISLTYFVFPWKESAGWLEWILRGSVLTIAINAFFLLRYFRSPEFKDITGMASELLKKLSKSNKTPLEE